MCSIPKNSYYVKITGEVASIESCRKLGRFLRLCLHEGHTSVVTDWTDVSEISGSLAGFLIVAHDRFRSAGGMLVLANAPNHIADIFKIVGLDNMIADEKTIPERNDKRAFVVDDDAYVREIFEEYLREAGYRTFSAANGRDAMFDFKMLHNNIDLVVTDVEMPEMDGLSFFQAAIKIRPDMPFVVATGYTHSEKVIGFREIRPDITIMRKPFLQSELENAVNSVISKNSTIIP
ncbi:MAG: response regulator [Fibrobacteres bacterium]|nr:response regulator [Fibrobacterota bacterium]